MPIKAAGYRKQKQTDHKPHDTHTHTYTKTKKKRKTESGIYKEHQKTPGNLQLGGACGCGCAIQPGCVVDGFVFGLRLRIRSALWKM
jgi:hypothetical protein